MKNNLKATLAVLCTAYLSVLAPPSLMNASITYDFGADFSATSNPNGVWSYGWSFANQFVLVGDPVPTSLQIQNEITLSAWIYVTEYPGGGTLGLIVGSQFDGAAAGATIFLDGRTSPDGQPAPPGHIHFQIGDGSFHTTNVNAQVPLNQWVHIAATRRANEDAKVYYNGVLQPSTSVPWSGSISYSGAWFAIGQQKDIYRPFDGLIDEVQIYNRALTANEVSALYNGGAPPSGLVSWWPGDGNANDIQGSNNGTLQNGATFASGQVGQCFTFDTTSRGAPFNLDLFEVGIGDGGITPGGIAVWFPYAGSPGPSIAHNTTNVTITPACCNPLPPRANHMHPGPGGENAVARWTAPAGGTYQVAASFSGGDLAGTTTDVAVLKNSTTELYAAEVTGYGTPSEQFFLGTVTVAAGDTIDFTVGFGTDGNWFSDSTHFTATITSLVSAQVQPPINADGTSIFNARRGVVPVKFTLLDNGVATCVLPPATIAVTRTAGGTTGSINESVYSMSADSGSNFRIDSCQYIYNLNSSALGVGIYRVDIKINNQVVGSATFQLK